MNRFSSIVLGIAVGLLATSASAGSFLVERRDNAIEAVSITQPMCPVRLRVMYPAVQNRPDDFHYFMEDEIQSMGPVGNDGVIWYVLDKGGRRIQGFADGEFAGHNAKMQMVDLWSESKNNEKLLTALTKIFPEKAGKCASYRNFYPGMFNGIPNAKILKVTFFDTPDGAAKVVQGQERVNQERVRQAEVKTNEFRKKMAPGMDSHCGMVIEVKRPLVKVQTMIGEKYFRVEQLYPVGLHGCSFNNGVYQE